MAAGDAPTSALFAPYARRAVARPLPLPVLPTSFSYQAPAPRAPKPKSIWEQLSDAVTNAPQGLWNMGLEAGQSVLGLGRLPLDVAGNVLTGKPAGQGFSRDYGTNLGEYFPLLETFRKQGSETAQDVLHPERFKEAYDRGEIVGKTLNDLATVAMLAGPAAKALTAASSPAMVSAEAAEAASRPAAAVSAFEKAAAPENLVRYEPAAPVEPPPPVPEPIPFRQALRTSARTLEPEHATYPRILRAAQKIEDVRHPIEQVAFSPVKLWTAPFKAVSGFDLPFVVDKNGEAIRAGVRPLLQKYGIEQAIREQPVAQGIEAQFNKWRDQAAERRDVFEKIIRRPLAEQASLQNRYARFVTQALKEVGRKDTDLQHATLIIAAGQHDLLRPEVAAAAERAVRAAAEYVPELADEGWQHRMSVAAALGEGQAASPQTIKYVQDWVNGTLDPEVAGKIDRATERLLKPSKEQEASKLSTERDPFGYLISGHMRALNPEQLDSVAMQSKIERIMRPREQARESLLQDVEGYQPPKGDFIPGLRQRWEKAQANVPAVETAPPLTQQAMERIRRAGGLEAEAGVRSQFAEHLSEQARRYEERAAAARQSTLAGARAEYDRIAAANDNPGDPRISVLDGEAERARGKASIYEDWMVPDDELAAAWKVLRLEGEDAIKPFERQFPKVARAQLRQAKAEAKATAARSELYQEQVRPVVAAAEQEGARLPFGETEWRPDFGPRPAEEGAPITDVERQAAGEAARQLRDSMDVLAARDAVGTFNLGGVEPVVPFIPEVWLGRQPQDALAIANLPKKLQQEYAKYGPRPAEYDWLDRFEPRVERQRITTKSGANGYRNVKIYPEDWQVLKRHMDTPESFGRGTKPDEWAGFLNAESARGYARHEGENVGGMAGGQVSETWDPSTAGEELIRRLKVWESTQDAARGRRPRFLDALDVTPEQRALLEGFKRERPSKQVTDELVEAWRDSARSAFDDDLNRYYFPSRTSEPGVWTLTPEQHAAELVDVNDVLAGAANVPFENWTPEQRYAAQRHAELVPEFTAREGETLTPDEVYRRIRIAAKQAGLDVRPLPGEERVPIEYEPLGAVNTVGRPERGAEIVAGWKRQADVEGRPIVVEVEPPMNPATRQAAHDQNEQFYEDQGFVRQPGAEGEPVRFVYEPQPQTGPTRAQFAKAGFAGDAEVADARAVAEQLFRDDQDTILDYATRGEPIPEGTLYRDQPGTMDKQTRAFYDALEARDKAGQVEQNVAEVGRRPIIRAREQGEQVGVNVGRAAGAADVLGREAVGQSQGAFTAADRAARADVTAEAAAEQGVRRAVRFGEGRGKAILREKQAGAEYRRGQKMLERMDERIATQRARLEQGPQETAPSRFIPAIAGERRIQRAFDDFAAEAARRSGLEPEEAAALQEQIAGFAPDAYDTVNALVERGVDPNYLMGLIDNPTSLYVSGGKQQLPYERTPLSERQKREGTVPREYRTVLRGYYREIADTVTNKSAQLLAREYAKTGRVLLDKLVGEGLIDENTARAKANPIAGERGEIGGLAHFMREQGYEAWDPRSPLTKMQDSQVTPDSLFLPKSVSDSFERWWKPRYGILPVRIYDTLTRGFKHNVLALSPRWHAWNIIGNAMMATFGAGESIPNIVRAAREASRKLKLEQGIGEVRPGDAPLGEPQFPVEIKGAGATAENLRHVAEGKVPRTWFGRAIHGSYALNEFVDDIGHAAVYLLKKEKGYTDEEAAALSLRAMGDFAKLSPFERDVVRRVIPFYSWAKHVTQATTRLTAEHPYRVAWLLAMSRNFADNDENLPEWLRGSVRGPGGLFFNVAQANPYEGSLGSLWNRPSDLPTQLGRSLNPVLKAGAALIGGWDVNRMEPISRPLGSGNVDFYGRMKPTMMNAWSEFPYFASQMLPAARLFHDLHDSNYLYYDTGEPIKRRGVPITREGGTGAWLSRIGADVGLPFMPTYYNEQTGTARAVKGRRTAERQFANYYGR